VASIHRALHDLCAMIDDPGRLETYNDARASLLSVVEERLIGSLVNEEKIEKASLNNVAFAFTQVFNARRLEQGQSTGNISVLAQIIDRAETTMGSGVAKKAEKANDSMPSDQ